MPTHAAVWIDHNEARIFHVQHAAVDESTVLAHRSHVHRHPKGRGEAREHPDDDRRFFGEVAKALDDADAILLVGPSAAKLEFFRYLHQHERRIESKVIGIETVDHPTDGQIVGMARTRFIASDRMG
jgi:stalled ribosome rescue protein Dom34